MRSPTMAKPPPGRGPSGPGWATTASYFQLTLSSVAERVCTAATPPAAATDATGSPHLTAHLRSLGVDATGLDPVPEFVAHARATYPDGRYGLGSLLRLPVPDGSVAGVLAWYSLIHLPPDDLDGVLAELRRAMAPGGTLVVGFVEGDEVVAFDHKVVTAYSWPVDAFAERLQRAGFTEVERQQRPGLPQPGRRPHAALAATTR